MSKLYPKEQEVLDLYKKTGALKEGHFRLSSGLHSDQYFQSALALSWPDIATSLGRSLAVPFKRKNIDIVIGPALGAIVIAQEVARALECPSFFAERVDDTFTLRRGFSIEEGMKVLLVEDVLTTGRSIEQLKSVIENARGHVVGYGCIINRMTAGAKLNLPVKELVRVISKIWTQTNCPLCILGKTLDIPGSRKTEDILKATNNKCPCCGYPQCGHEAHHSK